MSQQGKATSILICFLIILFHFEAKKAFAGVKIQVNNEFLTAPFYGTKTVSNLFDHEYPRYEAEANPPYNGNPQTILHNDGNYHQNQAICAGYSGHPGIDFPMFYEQVLAAHDGQVFEAGWHIPENRRWHFGLYVEVRVTRPNGERYRTRYAHLSSLMVQVGEQVTRQSLIGISGNTGNSSGPHLHFDVEKQHTTGLYRAVNPYGWHGNFPDPWHQQGEPESVNLWENSPSIIPYSTCPVTMYPAGLAITPISDPPLIPDFSHPERLIVDDFYDGRFSYSGPGWQLRLCANAGNDYCFGPEGQATQLARIYQAA